MKQRQLELLRRIAEAPRTLHQMTMHRRITAPTIARIGWVRRAGR
jgi:HAMP domain-containing protein